MFSLLGAPALSQFRLDKLLAVAAGATTRGSVRVSSRLIHFVDASAPLDESQLELLGKLLTYGPRAAIAGGARAAPARDAAPGHRVALVEQGHRHRSCLRPGGRAPAGARHAVFHRRRGRARRRRAARSRGAAARPHDRIAPGSTRRIRCNCFTTAAPRPLRVVRLGETGTPRSSAPMPTGASRCRSRRSIIWCAAFGTARARSDRCRTDDVRAGEFRALPAQDLQRRVHRSTAPRCPHVAVRHDSRHLCGEFRGRAVRLSGQRGGDRGIAARRGSSRIRRRNATWAVAEPVDILMKVETHNHPTAISPFPGAATGSGGEIRDEGATGIGRQTEGGLDGLFGVESAHSGHGAAVGGGISASRSASPRRSRS